MIRAVLWDIDGTLLNFLKAEEAGVRKCFEIFDLGPCTDEMIRDYSSINDRYWKRLERGEMTRPQILVGRFTEFMKKYNIDTSVAEAFNQEYQIRLGDTICFQEHAIETLTALKGKVVQCAVTNGTRTAQERKLRRSGMDRIFDYIFISEDIGIEKPDIGFFETVFAKIGPFQRDEILIVGDSLTSDMQGGINAGIRTCWFNPEGKANTKDFEIDYTIRDLAQVKEICKEAL